MRMTSIRTRLLLLLVVPLTLLAFVVSVEAYFSVSRTSNELHDRTLQTVLITLSEHMLANDDELVAENLLEVLTESLGDQFFYHFAGPENAWVIGYAAVPPRPPGVDPISGRVVFYDGEYQGDPVRAVVLRQLAQVRDANGWTTLTVWQRVKQRRALALDLFTGSLLRLALLVGAAALITWWAVSRGLRPLDDLRDAVEIRSPDDLSPIRRHVPTELRPISQAMNALFRRVLNAGQARERLIGDAAHQLRNPVAALHTQAQNVVAATTVGDAHTRGKALVESTSRLTRLVDQMLSSARSNSGEINTSETVEIVALAADVARDHGGRAVAKGQELSFETVQDAVVIPGNTELLRELFTNLVDNAIRHNDRGTAIAVGVKVHDSRVELSVADTGRAFDEQRLAEYVAPFRTGGAESAGSGLGLSIVADIVRLHDGTLEVCAGPGSTDFGCTELGSTGKTLLVTLPRNTKITGAMNAGKEQHYTRTGQHSAGSVARA